ncbi:MAG: transposase, partial [Planctomycetaceae bacterium]|nr:transposase [Planctomycetaceae bacterium]
GQRKPRQIRELVIQVAKTTGFGYTRIIGELRKLGIKKISRQTVRNILKEEGIQPGPDRSTDTWENFIQRHGETLWAVDFFSVRSITAKGFQPFGSVDRLNFPFTFPKLGKPLRNQGFSL